MMKRSEPVTLTNMCMINKKDKILYQKWGKAIKKETGLFIKDPHLVGVKQFFDKNDERYLVFFYIATDFTGTVKASDEGKLTWMTKEELISKKLAYNFDHDLPVFFDKNLSEHLLDGKIDQTY